MQVFLSTLFYRYLSDHKYDILGYRNDKNIATGQTQHILLYPYLKKLLLSNIAKMFFFYDLNNESKG